MISNIVLVCVCFTVAFAGESKRIVVVNNNNGGGGGQSFTNNNVVGPGQSIVNNNNFGVDGHGTSNTVITNNNGHNAPTLAIVNGQLVYVRPYITTQYIPGVGQVQIVSQSITPAESVGSGKILSGLLNRETNVITNNNNNFVRSGSHQSIITNNNIFKRDDAVTEAQKQ